MSASARVLVTAAAGGIGASIARAFAGSGARVHIGDIDAGAIEKFRVDTPGVTATIADVSDPDAVDRLFDEADSALGGLDVLVNNVGVAGPIGPMEQLDVDEWRRTLEINVNGQFLCSRRAIPALKQSGGGCIVNMSSTAGLMGCPNRSPYVASKWAIIGLTKTLAMELGELGIRVNAICPGSVEGERIERVIARDAAALGKSEDEVRANYVAYTSMKTFIQPEEVASLVLFLCSDAARHITGQALSVDGNSESLRG